MLAKELCDSKAAGNESLESAAMGEVSTSEPKEGEMKDAEEMLTQLLKGLTQAVYVQSVNTSTGKKNGLEPRIEDQEAIIVIQGEWDREDLKDVLKSLIS